MKSKALKKLEGMVAKAELRKPSCKRCGQPFEARYIKEIRSMSRCCPVCSMRNLFDGLGLPTPPELIDAHSKIPCLSEWEYSRKVEDLKREELPEEILEKKD